VVHGIDSRTDVTKPRGKQTFTSAPQSICYPRTTGIWQDVWLEHRPSTWIERTRWTPNLERWEIGCSVWLSGDPIGGELELDLTSDSTVVARDRYALVASEVHRRIALPDPGIDDFRNALLWSPESPTLIQATVTIPNEEGRLGLLVWEEMPSAYRFTEQAVVRTTREWMDAISRDANHPCVVAWVPFNESWGVPNLPHSAPERHFVRALYELTRRPASGPDRVRGIDRQRRRGRDMGLPGRCGSRSPGRGVPRPDGGHSCGRAPQWVLLHAVCRHLSGGQWPADRSTGTEDRPCLDCGLYAWGVRAPAAGLRAGQLTDALAVKLLPDGRQHPTGRLAR
jgi:hypothetical protein